MAISAVLFLLGLTAEGAASVPVGPIAPAALGASLLALWDAEAGGSITQSGGTVSAWVDSVAALTLAQATGANQPAYSATGLNGRPALVADGATSYMGVDSVVGLPIGASPCEIWVLSKNDALAADATIRRTLTYGSLTSSGWRTNQRNVVGGVNRGQAAAGTTLSSMTSIDLSGVHVQRSVFTGTAVRHDVDGVAGTPTAVVPSTGNQRTRLFASTADLAGAFWQGSVNLVMITAPLTAGQAAGILLYFKARGGLP